MLAALAGPSAAQQVTNLNDSGPGSLRQAIASAAPGATITFGVVGTIVLTSGELVIDKDLVLDGPGSAALFISGNGASRVLTVAPGVTAGLYFLTIRDGLSLSGAGAGIRNLGTLDLAHCQITENQQHSLASTGGGGVANFGTFSALGCGFTSNAAHQVTLGGGGILNAGSMDLSTCFATGNTADAGNGGGILNAAGGIATLDEVLVYFNAADNGGGVYADGMLSAERSSLSYNVATSFGGGLHNVGDATLAKCSIADNSAGVWGGGIMNWDSVGPSTLTALNCTVSGNGAALGGGVSNFDDATLSFVTVTNNEFGIENLGALSVKSSIVANNLFQDCLEPFTTMAGTNYDSDGSCGAGFTLASPAQLNLGPLAFHGGATLSHALLPRSVAINQASDCTDFFGTPVLEDQGGTPRPQGSACDVGAFEVVRD